MKSPSLRMTRLLVSCLPFALQKTAQTFPSCACASHCCIHVSAARSCLSLHSPTISADSTSCVECARCSCSLCSPPMRAAIRASYWRPVLLFLTCPPLTCCLLYTSDAADE